VRGCDSGGATLIWLVTSSHFMPTVSFFAFV
jgi:hypothetical protein